MVKLTRRQVLATSLAVPVLAASGARAATYQVTIQGFAFNPAAFKVAAGDTVIFINADGSSHTATARDGAFDTGKIAPGQSVEVTIPAGSHDFVCSYHPSMTGNATAE